MPSVSGPSDGGYNYYHKQIGDLEDELQAEAKKRRTNQEQQIDELERRYEANLRKNEEKLNETVNDVKENAQNEISREREYSKNEIDRIKAQTYDKWGRYNGLEGDVLNEQLKQLQQSSEIQHKRDVQDLEDANKTHEQRISDLNRDHQENLERAIDLQRTSANEAYNRAYSEGRDVYNDDKRRYDQRFEELNRERMEQQNFHRREAENAINEARHEYEHKLAKTNNTDESRFRKQQRALADAAEESTRNLNNSHADETRKLRDEIKNLLDAESHYVKEKNQGYHDATEEYENDWRAREKQLMEGYEKSISKMKAQEKEADKYNTFISNQALREKDTYFSDVISKQNVENRNRQKEIESTFSRSNEELIRQAKRDQELSRKAHETALTSASKQKDEALANQAKNYQETIARIREGDQQEVSALQKELLVKTTSGSTADISPAAEANVRKNVIGEYEKVMNAETDRNKRTVESLQQSYSGQLRNTIEDHSSQKAAAERQNAYERNQERGQLLTHIKDIEFMRDNTLRNQDFDHTRETENLTRNWAAMIERQRHEYEDILLSTKDEAAARLAAQRQESEFNSKMAQRAFASRENELIRDYSKRLADQKAEFSAQMEEVKSQASLTVREADRKSRQALDEQARSYEQRIAQMEYQQKERERYLTQSYQDELEKVKRSHAQLIQKKG